MKVMDNKVLEDNQITIRDLRTMWLDFLRDLYIYVFFKGNASLYDENPRDVLERNMMLPPNEGIDRLFLQEYTYACEVFAQKLVELLFFSVGSIKCDNKVCEFPNDTGNGNYN